MNAATQNTSRHITLFHSPQTRSSSVLTLLDEPSALAGIDADLVAWQVTG